MPEHAKPPDGIVMCEDGHTAVVMDMGSDIFIALVGHNSQCSMTVRRDEALALREALEVVEEKVSKPA